MAEETAQAVETPAETQAAPESTEAVPEWVGTLGERFDKLEERMSPPEPEVDLGTRLREPEYEDEPEPEYEDEPEPEDYGDLSPDQAQQALQQMIQQGVQEQLGPMAQQMKQITDANFDREVLSLQEKYPALKDPEKATEVVNYAKNLFTKLGAPQLAAQPEIAGLVFQALQGQENASQETPAGADEQEVSLETGGGSQAQADQTDADALGDRMLQAGNKGLPF